MTEGTGPVKSGNLIFVKVPNPADYPKDKIVLKAVYLLVSGFIFWRNEYV